MKKIEHFINSTPDDYKYVGVVNIPCYVNTIISTTNNPYGDFDYYKDVNETYKWHYKLNQEKVSNHYQKVMAMIYNNGTNSCTEILSETLNLSELIPDGQDVATNNMVPVELKANYAYSSDLQSTYFMIRVELPNGVSPVIYNESNSVAVKVHSSYDTDTEHVEDDLIAEEDMLDLDKQKTPVSYRVIQEGSGFIIKFYNEEYNPEYEIYNYDYIHNHKRNIEFTVNFNVSIDSDVFNPKLNDSLNKYICYPTTEEDEVDTLYIQLNTLSLEDKAKNPEIERIYLNDNLTVSIAHFPETDDTEAYDIILGYVYSDFKFTCNAHSNNYEILENLIHEDVM